MIRSILVLLALAAGVATAEDVIDLANGNHLRGRIVAERDGTVTLRVRGGTIRIEAREIASIQRDVQNQPGATADEGAPAPAPERDYAARLATLAPDDALGLARLAAWCRDSDLNEEADECQEMALALAPDDPAVREALGHVKNDRDEWQDAAAVWRARGLVEVDGAWMTPEERDRRATRLTGQSAHAKRREISVRARAEIANIARSFGRAEAGEREDILARIRERLVMYARDGAPALQGLPAQDTALAAALDEIAAGQGRAARERLVEVMRACDGVQRWEDAAAHELELLALAATDPRDGMPATAREAEALAAINAMRRDLGLAPLVRDVSLAAAALGHDLEMIRLGYVDHDSPTPGRTSASERSRAAGGPAEVGENIYYGGLSSEAAVRAWANSLGHADNMLLPEWRRAGLAAVGRHWTLLLAR